MLYEIRRCAAELRAQMFADALEKGVDAHADLRSYSDVPGTTLAAFARLRAAWWTTVVYVLWPRPPE